MPGANRVLSSVVSRIVPPAASCIGRCSLCVMHKRHALFVRRRAPAACVAHRAVLRVARCVACGFCKHAENFFKKCLTEIAVLLI